MSTLLSMLWTGATSDRKAELKKALQMRGLTEDVIIDGWTDLYQTFPIVRTLLYTPSGMDSISGVLVTKIVLTVQGRRGDHLQIFGTNLCSQHPWHTKRIQGVHRRHFRLCHWCPDCRILKECHCCSKDQYLDQKEDKWETIFHHLSRYVIKMARGMLEFIWSSS